VIDEVQASPKPIILFIDEAHTLIGAGGAAGQGDAANLLKPALARGDAAHDRGDHLGRVQEVLREGPALTRRFQVVKVEEPTRTEGDPDDARRRGMLEKHHKVRILDEALEEAVRLSHRYIPARQLPDKAVSLLDTACARVAMAVPPRRSRIASAGYQPDRHRGRDPRPRDRDWRRATPDAKARICWASVRG
jgi:type VI secretion system protein VasG